MAWKKRTRLQHTRQFEIGVAWSRKKGRSAGRSTNQRYVHRECWNVHVLAAMATQICRGLYQSCPSCCDYHCKIRRGLASLAPLPDLPHHHWSCPTYWLDVPLAHITVEFAVAAMTSTTASVVSCSLYDLLFALYVPTMIWAMMDVRAGVNEKPFIGWMEDRRSNRQLVAEALMRSLDFCLWKFMMS